MIGKEPGSQGRRPRRLRRRIRRDLTALGAVLLGYSVLAYVAVPAWWRHHTPAVDLAEAPTVTRTKDSIPGDPVNVALVGTRAEVIHALVVSGGSDHLADQPADWRERALPAPVCHRPGE